MNHLLREIAPVTESAWDEIEDEAQTSLKSFLAARRLVDFTGPLGWDHNAIGTGRLAPAVVTEGVRVAPREVQTLVELRATFDLSREELEVVDRGRPDEADLDPVTNAAKAIATAENSMVFNGSAPAGVRGMTEASPHAPLPIEDDYERYPSTAAKAVALLREAGVDGPYGLALGNRCYTGVIESTQKGGYPVLEHLRLILGGPVVWAPDVDGALVISQRGGDFELVSGADLAVGYLAHDAQNVALYLEESLTFRVHSPEAAVWLRYHD